MEKTAGIAEKQGGVPGREEIFARARALFGGEAMERLYGARVAVFGVGGVGGYAVEALARGGIGRLDLFDHDVVTVSNINRQLAADLDTVGRYKVDVMRERIARIHPQAQVQVYRCFYLPENADDFDLGLYDYVVDAVDTVAAKVELVGRRRRGVGRSGRPPGSDGAGEQFLCAGRGGPDPGRICDPGDCRGVGRVFSSPGKDSEGKTAIE